MSSRISVITTGDGDHFLRYAGEWLNRNEPDNNTILAIAGDAGSLSSLLRPPFWFGLAACEKGAGGAAVFAHPDGLVVSDMEDRYLPPLFNAFISDGLLPHRIYGPPRIARIFASKLRSALGQVFRQQRKWLAFVISAPISAPRSVTGGLRRATLADADVVRRFGRNYGLEKPSIVDVAEYFLSKLRTGNLYCWVDNDEVKTVVATAGSTENVIRIAGVFTAGPFRGVGYARAAVASVTNLKLSAGFRSVTLVVDRDDATAIQMYESLGYRPLHVRVEMTLVNGGTSP